jgi:hypothetical protein
MNWAAWLGKSKGGEASIPASLGTSDVICDR